MPLGRWKRLRKVFEMKNPWWTYRTDDVELPTGKKGEYHYVHVLGSSMILPVDEEGRILLVNQYRYLADRESLEFPCGSVKEGSSFEETARHELAEETGCAASSLECVGKFNPYNGVTDEFCNIYIARGLKAVTAAHDDTEEFEQVRLSPPEIDGKVSRGEIWDGMTLAAWAIVRSRFLPGART